MSYEDKVVYYDPEEGAPLRMANGDVWKNISVRPPDVDTDIPERDALKRWYSDEDPVDEDEAKYFMILTNSRLDNPKSSYSFELFIRSYILDGMNKEEYMNKYSGWEYRSCD